MRRRLSPELRWRIFLRVLCGNEKIRKGEKAESHAQIARACGVARETVRDIARCFGGDGLKRRRGRHARRVKCLDCPARAEYKDRCEPCYRRHRYATEPELRERLKANKLRYEARRREAIAT